MSTTEEAMAALDRALGFLDERLERDRPMGPLCTYRVGGPARRFVEARNTGDIERIAAAIADVGIRPDVLVVGKGSNLLVSDSGFEGLVVHLGDDLAAVEVEGVVVRAGAAASLPVVARRSVAEGLAGFEWAVGVPGSVGGAVRMNAGGHGSDMSESLMGVRVVDLHSGETSEVTAPDLRLAYRSSALAPHQVVVRADIGLHVGDRVVGEAQISDIVRWRRENQPGGHNAGSVFTNPPGDSAGRMIDAAGAKGLRIGTAAVSDKHANFIQSDDDGSADDVFAVMVAVARLVRERLGADLHPETRLVGFSDFAGAVTSAGPEPGP